MIVSLLGEKGGPGKSTIATNLAVWGAYNGRDQLLVDADPQATAARWAKRRARGSLKQVVCIQQTQDIGPAVRDQATRYQDIIIDTGGRNSEELRSAMLVSDMSILPVKASQFDLETLPEMAKLIKEVRGLRQLMNLETKAFVILSMTSTNKFIKSEQSARETLEAILDIPVLPFSISHRKVFEDVVIDGSSVLDSDNEKAKADINRLGAFVFNGE